MNFTLRKFWLIICILIVFIIWFEIEESTNRKYYKEKIVKYEDAKGKPEEFDFSISICYPLRTKENHCPDQVDIFKGFNCKDLFGKQISCYYEQLKDKVVGFDDKYKIIELFRSCELHNLAKISSQIIRKEIDSNHINRRSSIKEDHIDNKNEIKKSEPISYLIENGNICIRQTYGIELNKTEFKFTIDYPNRQLFRVSVNLRPVDYPFRGLNDFIFSQHCYGTGIDQEKCFNKTEERHYELSITKFNLKTEDKNYQSKCCSNCKKKQEEKTDILKDHYHVKEGMKDYNCDECSIYCYDTYQYKMEVAKFGIDTLKKINQSKLNIKFYSEYKELDNRTKSDDFSPFMLKLFYICFLLNINLHSISELALKKLLEHGRFLILRSLNAFKILKLIIFLVLIIVFISKLILFCINNEPSTNYLIEPLFINDNVSVTICFNYSKVLKPKIDKNKTCLVDEDDCTLRQLEDLTWNETNFVENIKVKTSIKPIPIKETEIKIVYKDKLKCFNYNYNQPTLVKFSSLMRSEVLEIEIENSNFTIFYVQPEGKLPGLDYEKYENFLLYKKIEFKMNSGCISDFLKETNNFCKYYGDCVDACILDRHNTRNHQPKTLPTNIKIEKTKFINNSLFLDSKFVDSHQHDEEAIKELNYCENEYKKKKNCKTSFLVSHHRYNFLDNKNKIQINLNPELEREEISNLNDDFRTFIFYLIPYLNLITSFSLTNYLKSKIVNLKKPIRLLIHSFYLLLFLNLFLIIINWILNEELESTFYSKYEEKLEIPRMEICWHIGHDKTILENLDGKTGFEINDEYKENLPEDLVKRIIYLNSTINNSNNSNYEYQSLNISMKPIDSRGRSVLKNAYWQKNKRCIETNFKDQYERTRFSHKGSDVVFEIELDSSKIIDNRVFIYLNSQRYISNDFQFVVFKNFNVYIRYQLIHSIREDTFFYFRKPLLFLSHLIYEDIIYDQWVYFDNLIKSFNKLTNSVTSLLSLSNTSLYHLKIENKLFLDFAYLRTLSSNIDDLNFDSNFHRKLIFFNYNFRYTPNNISIITIIPDFISPTTFKYNKSSRLNFIIVVFSIMSICFNFSLVELPSILKFWFKLLKIFLKKFYNLIVLLFFKLLVFKKKLFIILRCRDVEI